MLSARSHLQPHITFNMLQSALPTHRWEKGGGEEEEKRKEGGGSCTTFLRHQCNSSATDSNVESQMSQVVRKWERNRKQVAQL